MSGNKGPEFVRNECFGHGFGPAKNRPSMLMPGPWRCERPGSIPPVIQVGQQADPPLTDEGKGPQPAQKETGTSP
jgi:hypothetical protein